MKPLRAAVVGCGLIAEFHLRGWQRIPGVEITALVDPDLARAGDRRTRFAPGAQLYADLDAALDADAFDFVDILTPPSLHAKHCLRARAAGLHVICQKPLCDDLAAARDLVAAFAGGPQLLCVHENHAYRPWFRRLAELHAAGSFGPLHQLQLVQHDPQAPPQRLNLDAPRGVLLQYGTHLIDLVRQLLGTPAEVSATTSRVNPHVRGESQARVTFTYPGCTATVDVAWRNDGVAHGGVLATGTRGSAVYEGTMIRGGAARFQLMQGQDVTLDETRSTVDDYVESFYAFELAFVDALRRGTSPPQPAAANLHTLAMTFAGYAAAEQDRPVVYADFLEHHAIAPFHA